MHTFALAKTSFSNVSPHAVQTLPAGIRVVDVREPDEWVGGLGHLPNAQLIPLANVKKQTAHWDRQMPVLLVCRSGGRSSQAAAWLVAAGFCQVHNLAGGMLAYNAAGLPVQRA